jgi:hypothetical protein
VAIFTAVEVCAGMVALSGAMPKLGLPLMRVTSENAFIRSDGDMPVAAGYVAICASMVARLINTLRFAPLDDLNQLLSLPAIAYRLTLGSSRRSLAQKASKR